MVKNLENYQKLFKLFEQIIVGAQILLIVLVALTSLVWLLKLINISALGFLNPVLNIIETAMQVQFGNELKQGKQGLDGALFVFIMLLLVSIYILLQVKNFAKYSIEELDRKIIIAKKEEEEKFNKNLEVEAQEELLKYNNIILIVKLKVEQITRNDYLNYGSAKPENTVNNEQVLSNFYNLFKDMPGCKFQKDGDILIVTVNNFKIVEPLFERLSSTLKTLRETLQRQKLSLIYNIAVDTFTNEMIVHNVYLDIKNVLKLQLPNEILCFGNFKNRYELIPTPKYQMYLKGSYRIINEENIYAIIKKD